MKKLAALMLSLALCLPLSARGAAYRVSLMPTTDFYVNDAAAVLFSEDRERMMDISAELEDLTGAQLVVLTIDSPDFIETEGGLEGFADAVFESWDIGGRQVQNGALILVMVKPAECAVKIGSKFGDGLSFTGDSVSEDITSAIKNNNASRGVLKGFVATALSLYEANGVPQGERLASALEAGDKKEFSFTPIFMLAAVAIILGRSMRITRKYNRRYAKGRIYKRKSFARPNRDDW